MRKKINGRPDEVTMDDFFGKNNAEYNQFYGTYPRGMKVKDRPEIKFPVSTYDPIPGAEIRGLQDENPVGTIRIDTIPIDAEFFIIDDQGNEISFGKTLPAITIIDVDVGTYNYVLRKEGYTDYTGIVEVKENQLCCISINMQESTQSGQCVTQPPGVSGGPGGGPVGGIPVSQPGYVVITEKNYYGFMGILAGLVIAGIVYFMLKKKD